MDIYANSYDMKSLTGAVVDGANTAKIHAANTSWWETLVSGLSTDWMVFIGLVVAIVAVVVIDKQGNKDISNKLFLSMLYLAIATIIAGYTAALYVLFK